MKILAILLVLPTLILAKIEIEVTASDEKSQREVHISGSNEDIISNTERETFNLTEDNLKDAVKAHLGARPDDVYLKSPTPWGDLYITNQWKQVTRTLKPLKAQIISIAYDQPLIYTQHFNNTSSKPANVKAQIRYTVENTVSSNWERNGELYANTSIHYDIGIKAMAVSGKATFSYISKWGENVEKSQTVTVGSETGLEIMLAPNQSVVADLYATRGSMKVRVDYVATLSGSVAVNYANLYKDHHFWSVDINKVLADGGLNRTVPSSEVIDLGFYCNSKVDIHETNNNSTVQSLPMSVF